MNCNERVVMAQLGAALIRFLAVTASLLGTGMR